MHMSKSPFINAVAAAAYIVFIATVMDSGTKRIGHVSSIIAPVAVLSLFTLSAAVMGYVFFFEPFQMYFDGKKKEAIHLALQSVAVFAGITVLFLVILFSGILF